MRKSALPRPASALMAAAAIGSSAMPTNIALNRQQVPNHRGVATGKTGALKIRRAARKARNRKANRG